MTTGLPGVARVDVESLRRDLESDVDGEVRFDAGSRGAYSTDASSYRQVPIGVVVPRTVDAGADAIRVCARHEAPVLSRGGGTSLAGQCTNVAVVIDWSKYCHHVLSVDPDAATCVVEPGIVLDELNDVIGEYGLQFGPRPATHSHCTLGGMIGNNSCGATAQRYGKTVDNVRRLEILTYDGQRCWVGPGGEQLEHCAGGVFQRAVEIAERYRDTIGARYPDIPRRVSGYNLDSLLEPAGPNAAKLLVGSESTLVTVLHAELDLVPVPRNKALAVLGFDTITEAADTVPRVLDAGSPLMVEGLGGELVHFMREQGVYLESIDSLPQGNSFLLVQFGGDTANEADERVHRLLSELGKDAEQDDVAVSDDPEREERMLKAREGGLGVTANPPDMPESWEGWEDSAVAPEDLGDYLRDLLALYKEFGYERPALYGHFGHGCVHIRSPFRLESVHGVATFREFVRRACELVVSYGGSLSGEHGDGQSRGEMLTIMFGEDGVEAFGKLKAAFDPNNRLNPGKIVAPHRVDEDLRLGATHQPEVPPTFLGYPEDGGGFPQAIKRCVGIGNCRRHSGGVMCPSYMVTGEEEHSTRGRARLLFEMMRGHADSPISDGWRSTSVRDALDLCLACKGCKSDCPTGVDMATYKAEFLAQHYRGRIRPASHYSLGWLPALAQAARALPELANVALNAPGLSTVGKWMAGVDSRRTPPRFARATFQDQWRHRQDGPVHTDAADTVVLWPDTFTNHFEPHIGMAAAEVLHHAGFDVVVPPQPVCCGLTWISTGQLRIARRILSRSLRILRPWLDAGARVVGLEPSCAAVFRADSAELLDNNDDARLVRDRFRTLAELLDEVDYRTPTVDVHALVQTHCHQHAIFGFDADIRLLHRAGVNAEVLDSGCCGLAGNFGFERGHYEVSMACAERVLLPAVRDAPFATSILADGFSCRTQIRHGCPDSQPLHLAQLLHNGLTSEHSSVETDSRTGKAW